MRSVSATIVGVIGAVIGAGAGYIAWLVLMFVWASVCRGILNWLACGGMGGPNVFDLLALPIAVVGGAVLGFNLGRGFVDERKR